MRAVPQSRRHTPCAVFRHIANHDGRHTECARDSERSRGAIRHLVVAALLALLPSAPLFAAGTETTRRAHDLNLTVATRWAGGANGGYFPVRIALRNLSRPRVLDLVFSDAREAGFRLPTVTRQVQIDQNASVQVTLPIPLVSAGTYGELKVFENGRELTGLTQHVTLPEAQPGLQDRPALLVISPSATTIDCSKFEDAVQALDSGGNIVSTTFRGRFGGVRAGYAAYSGLRSNDFQTIAPVLLPESWIDYSVLDVVAIPLASLDKASEAARSALLKWTASGGTLLIYDVGQSASESSDLARLLDLANRPPSQQSWQPADPSLHQPIAIVDESTGPRTVSGVRVFSGDENADEEAQEVEAANKPVWPVAKDTFWRLDLLAGQVCAFPGNPFPGSAVDWAWWLNSSKPQRLKWTTRHGLSCRQSHPEFSLFLIPGVGAVPLLAFVVLISVFAIVIGPVNYFLVWRRKQLYLLVVTIPLIAFLTSGALFGYAMVSDGFGVQSRLRSFTLLDQYSRTAVAFNRISLYAGVTPSAGLKFSSETAVLPVWRDAGCLESGTVDWTNTQHLARGWLRTQTTAQFETIAIRAERGRLDIRPAAEGELEVSNGLEWEISRLLVKDDAGRIYAGQKIPAGAKLRLATASAEDLAALSSMLAADPLKAPLGADIPSPQPATHRGGRTVWTTGEDEPTSAVNFSGSQLERYLKLLTKPEQLPSAGGLAPRTYLAVIPENPGIELGVDRTRPAPGLHVIMGFY